MAVTDWDTILFNAAAFVAALFLLEFGADKFIDHTAIVARRLGVSQTLVALLTAGAEWEELAVVVAAVIQHQSPLAIGNVLGSGISNVLGAFSLGLLFRSGAPMVFDRSSKIYTALLLLLTTVVVALAFFGRLGKVAGGVFVGVFALYVVSVGVAIYKGVLDAPEGSEDESSDDERSDPDSDAEDASLPPPHPSESSPLIAADQTPTPRRSRRQSPHGLTFHLSQLLLGFTALSLSGYLLAHTAAALAAALHLSGTVLGITLLSLATTLPEKFVAVLGGSRGHAGIVVANTVGSNIFLLTLCLGVVLLAGELDDGRAGGVSAFELAVTWGAAAVLLLVVVVGPGRWAGGIMLVLYGGFLGLEFTVFRR